MPDHTHTAAALRAELRRTDRPGELAVTPRMRRDGQLLYVATTSARTRRRARGAAVARAPVQV